MEQAETAGLGIEIHQVVLQGQVVTQQAGQIGAMGSGTQLGGCRGHLQAEHVPHQGLGMAHLLQHLLAETLG